MCTSKSTTWPGAEADIDGAGRIETRRIDGLVQRDIRAVVKNMGQRALMMGPQDEAQTAVIGPAGSMATALTRSPSG